MVIFFLRECEDLPEDNFWTQWWPRPTRDMVHDFFWFYASRRRKNDMKPFEWGKEVVSLSKQRGGTATGLEWQKSARGVRLRIEDPYPYPHEIDIASVLNEESESKLRHALRQRWRETSDPHVKRERCCHCKDFSTCRDTYYCVYCHPADNDFERCVPSSR